MYDDDDRSALNRYRQKVRDLDDVRQDGGDSYRERCLKEEASYIWDQMSEEEKAEVRKDRTPQDYPSRDLNIEQIPVVPSTPIRNKTKKVPWLN